MEGDIDSGVAAIGRALFGDVLGDKEGSTRDVLAGGEAKKAGQVFASVETMHVTDFADQGQGVTDTGTGSFEEQLGLRMVLDQTVTSLEEEGFVLLTRRDVIDQLMYPLANHLPTDFTSEELRAQGDQVFCVCTTESRTTMGFQDGRDGIYPGSDVLVREDVVLE